MITPITYRFATVSEEDGIFTVSFADAEFETQEYLILQKTLENEEEEDGIYIERDGQEQGIYGGIERCVLSRQHVFCH